MAASAGLPAGSAGVGTILKYLGPWAGMTVPPGIERRLIAVESRGAEGWGPDGAVRAYVFRPMRPDATLRGVLVVLHGLHYLGPEDHRLERFCRILAAAGHVVLAPFLPRSLELEASEATTAHVARITDEAAGIARDLALPPPAIFTISFGSLSGIRVAAARGRSELSSIILFGGYARFEDTLRFALTGEDRLLGTLPDRDPLNVPAIFINLLAFFPAHLRKDLLKRAWLEVVRATWGQLPMRVPETRRPIVEAAALRHGLNAEERVLFEAGCGLRDGREFTRIALAEAGGPGAAFADPRPALARVRVPVFVLHGRDDDVIPWTEAHAIRAHLPAHHPHALLFSGMHGHTGTQIPHPRDVARELGVSLSIARVFAGAAVDPEGVLAAIARP